MTAELRSKPLTEIRPTRRTQILRVSASVIGLVLALLGRHLLLVGLPIALAAMSVFCAVPAIRDLVMVVRFDADALTFRDGAALRRVARPQVFDFTVVSRAWVRYVVVGEKTRGFPRRTRLPAPVSSQIIRDPAFDRDVAVLRAWAAASETAAGAPSRLDLGGRRLAIVGVIAALLVGLIVDRPQGWFDGSEASTLPDTCAALSGPLTAIGATDPTPTPGDGCRWNLSDGQVLGVSYQLYHRHGIYAGWDQAARALQVRQTDMFISDGYEPIDDQVTQAHEDIDGGAYVGLSDTAIMVLARKANVVLDLTLTGPRTDSAGLHAATVACRAATAAIQTT